MHQFSAADEPCEALSSKWGITKSKQAFLPALFEFNDSSHPLKFTVSVTSEATICISQHMETLSRTGRLHELDHKDSIARSKPNQARKEEEETLCVVESSLWKHYYSSTVISSTLTAIGKRIKICRYDMWPPYKMLVLFVFNS